MRWKIMATLCIVLGIFAFSLAGYHISPRGAAEIPRQTNIIDFLDFPGGRALLVDAQGDHAVRLVCNLFFLWRSCGGGNISAPVNGEPVSELLYWTAYSNDGILVFAGLINDRHTTHIVVRDEAQEVIGRGYFMFVWRTKNVQVHAQAINQEGEVIYEFGQSTNWRWISL